MAVTSRRPARSRPLIWVLALVSVTLIALDGADSGPVAAARSEVRDLLASAGESVSAPFGDSDDVDALQRRNAELEMQLRETQGQLTQQGDAQRERDRLVALLGLPTPEGVPKVVARVVATGTSNFDASIELGKGSNDGIAAGMPVISGEGLVGRVVRVSGERSSVLLIQDTTSNVGVRVASTGEIGVAVGGGMNQGLRLDLIDLDSPAKAGDVVVTSGMQRSLFPPGIPVGTIRSSEARPQDLRRDVVVESFVDTRRLDNVAVLQWQPPPPEP